ncbi:MAG: CHRD domain-containing protein [Actinomycetota bacterium]
MQRRMLGLTAIALGLTTMLTLAAGAGARADGAEGSQVLRKASKVTVLAALRASEEVPPSTGAEAARGGFLATVKWTGDGAEFTWRLAFRDLTGPAIAAHIHVAPRGEAGEIVVPLCAPCTNNQRGLAEMDVGTISAMNAGRAYVNIHTARNPAGEIRGQIEVFDKLATTLTVGQEIPRPRGTSRKTKGGFTVTIRRSFRGTTFRWRLEWFALTGRPIAAHVHVGARGKAGRVIISICGAAPRDRCINERGGSIRLSPAQAQALENGNIYVNLHTKRNPAGEVRGQLRAARLTLRTS